jgi:glyoxylase-like metal-dependent hydrolase (beta-lactamase superfamily II)/rhodanese-related sulfurtransferase
MILDQLYLGCLAQASYLVGDPATGLAAAVDPRRDLDELLDLAAKRGLRIRHVLLTHFHADYVSGHLELARRTGATVHLGAKADAEYPFERAGDGDTITLGAVRLRILETPGHTPESISILVLDGDRPHAVLTGDALFVGDVGRPDLMASSGVTPQDLAGRLYDSLHRKLLALPDDVLVYPAHGAGSLCGKALAEETFSTIGRQRRFNPMLQPMSRDEFVRRLTADQPEAPAYFAMDAALNRKGVPALDEALAGLKPLPIDRVVELLRDGAQVVDGREADAYQKAHLAGSTHLPLSAKYAIYAGMVLDPSRPIVVLAPDGREREAAMRLARIGFDGVLGWVQGGIDGVPASLRRGAAHVTVAELATWMGRPDAPALLDVRMPGEHRDARIAGSALVPLHRLRERASEIPRGRWVAIYCRTGHRSSVAQSICEQLGIDQVANVDGGIVAWKDERRPIVMG